MIVEVATTGEVKCIEFKLESEATCKIVGKESENEEITNCKH